MTNLHRAMTWWYGRGREPASRAQMLASIALPVLALLVAARVAYGVASPVLKAPRPVELPAWGPDGMRFGLSLETRRKVFDEIAATEATSRATGLTSFPTQPWSAEDHRCAQERFAIASVATRNGVTLTQAYLVLDEGIREHWPGPDGQPLDPHSVPLKPRRKY